MTLIKWTNDRNAQFWMLQLIGWVGWVVLFGLRDIYWGKAFEGLPVLIIDAVAGCLLTTCLRYVYHAVWDEPIITRVVAVLVCSYMVAAVWQPFKNFVNFSFYSDFAAVDQHGMMAYFSGIIPYSFFLMLCWSGLYFGLKFYRLLQEQIKRSIKAESMAHEAQLRMLRYQLNPHFLFNTLNAISTLILEQNTRVASQMVNKLSNFLRYSLENDPMQRVDVEHEINSMKLYLEIEQVRFDERLQVEFNIEPEASKALVPSLLLQPLVENAIKYAVAPSESGGKITINARLSAGSLLLEVIDDGPGLGATARISSDGSGVGLANTRERLEALYGDGQLLKFSEASPHGLKIEIHLPFVAEAAASPQSIKAQGRAQHIAIEQNAVEQNAVEQNAVEQKAMEYNAVQQNNVEGNPT